MLKLHEITTSLAFNGYSIIYHKNIANNNLTLAAVGNAQNILVTLNLFAFIATATHHQPLISKKIEKYVTEVI